ncbi:MAG: hypothetical protein RL536_262 [Candidatus Parcubacteria bacterium]|jgi:hypothetical protein
MSLHIFKKNRGFTLVETIFYTFGLIILLGAMSAFMYYMYDWYQRTTVGPRTDRIGVSLVDRIAKDIRSGTAINSGQSSFATNNGVLSFDANVNSTILTKRFALTNNRLTYQEAGVPISYLSPSDINVTRFYVVSTSTPVSKGIKFDIDLTYLTRANGSTTQTYSGFVILRQSY